MLRDASSTYVSLLPEHNDQMKILHHEIIHVVWCNFMLTLNYILQIHYFEFKMVNVANIEKWMGGS